MELNHQIFARRSMGIEGHNIPDYDMRHESLLPVMRALGAHLHPFFESECLQSDDPILGLCNSEFLETQPD